MSLRLIQIIGIIGLCLKTHAASNLDFSITAVEVTNAQIRLETYDKGLSTMHQLFGQNPQENCRQIVGYYLKNTNGVTAKEKLPISRCYIAFGDFSKALPLAQDYVNVYSNDFNGWEALAYCYVAMTNDAAAIVAYKMAVKLGDEDAYQALAGEAIRAHRLDVIPPILPKLQELQRAKTTSMDDKINLTTILLSYSLIMDQKNLFVQTLQGQNTKELLKDDTARKNIASGCEMFSGPDIDKIHQELETNADSSSSTNMNRP